jgi:hypothetical protein
MQQTPAEKQKAFRGRAWPGKLCIFTVAGGPYQNWAPLFVAMAKEAYPEADVKVLVPGEMTIPETPDIISVGSVLPIGHPLLCASLRFLICPEWITGYDYVLITDADMMIVREEPGIVSQHMMSMELNGTECYDNWLMAPGRMPGIHFVTREWWGITDSARRKETGMLVNPDVVLNIQPADDERVLHRIVTNSGLPPAPATAHTWTNHGIHLGAHRKYNGMSLQLTALEQSAAIKMVKYEDEISVAASEFPWIRRFVKDIKTEFHV